VNCETQEEVDYFGESSLPTAGRKSVWLAEGQVWFVMAGRSHNFAQAVQNKDPEKTQRVMKAMLQMKKIDIGKLKEAAEGQ